jgi:glc operon protein GlcG
VPTGAVATEAGTWPMRPTLPAALSRRLVDAAVLAATDLSMPVTVVIVDESGVLMELCRMDGAALVSVEAAKGKACAAVATGMPPDEFYGAIETDGGSVAWFASRPGLALVAGGIPVIADGRVAGAIGVAGAMTAAEDRRIAETAIQRALPQGGRR